MHIVYFNPYLDAQMRTPTELLRAWSTLSDVPEAIAGAGGGVTVIQAAHITQRLQRNGVHYQFVDARTRGPARLARATAALAPDVVHCNGFSFPHHLRALRAALPDCPLLVQDHSDRPPPWRRALWRRALADCDAVAFMAAAQAEPFVRADVLAQSLPVYEIPESATHFAPGDRDLARAAHGITGDPAIVAIARLTPDKDPLTIVRAFRTIATRLPNAKLWLVHDNGPLLERVRAAADGLPVQLLTRMPHERIELLLRAADIYVSASHREGSGYAAMEALACGTPTVLSDIPAHRVIISDGAAGVLFRRGDATSLANAMERTARELSARRRDEVRNHFDATLSADAVGRRLMNAYEELCNRRAATPAQRLRIALIVPGGVDRSGTERVIPRFLWLIERLAGAVDLHVIALRQETRACTYQLLGATVHCIPAAASRLEALRQLQELHHTYRFDLLHALWMHPQGTLAGAIGTLTRTPVLLHLEGGDLAALPDIAFGGRQNHRGKLWLHAATRTASYVTVSSALLQRTAETLGIRAELISFGVAADRWPAMPPRTREPGTPARLLHVGTINRVKDHSTLLHALSQLKETGCSFHADLIGEDLLSGEIHRLADALGLHDHVTLHGWKSHRDVRPFFEQAHVHVVSSRYEGGPFAAHEAAAVAVPTVGTAVGDLVEWAPHAAVTVPVGDATALCQALRAVIEDEPRRMRLGWEAQQRALTVDADASAARVVQIYRSLTARTRRRRVLSRTDVPLPA
jgi:glycosyltransferase involved in cell wall biosynthesis